MRHRNVSRFLTTTLSLFISAFAFSQVKVNIEIEGNGVVCVQDSSFDGSGKYKYEDADFYWGRNTTLTFRIKPGKQCYLDGIWVSYAESDSARLIPRSAIYAGVTFLESKPQYDFTPDVEKSELRYDAREEEKFATYRFVFKTVKPWDGTLSQLYEPAHPHLMFLVYTPEEFIYACTQPFDPELDKYVIAISLQNDIDLNGKEISSHNGRDIWLHGNNKTIKNCYGQKNRELLSRVDYIGQLHVLSGNVSLFSLYNYRNYIVRTITGCTSNTDDSTFDGPVFFLKDNIYEESGDCINFGDNAIAHNFFKKETWRGSTYKESIPLRNLINWGSSKVVSSPNDSLGCFEMGRWIQPINFFNYGKTERFWSLDKTDEECLLYNNSTLGSKTFGKAKDSAGYYSIPNDKLVDSAFMRKLMGDSAEKDFIFEDGFYPRLRHMDERPGRLAASPILLYPGEKADNVLRPFYVDTNYGVRWVSLSPGLVEIEGDSGYVRMPVSEDSVVRIEAWKEDFSKHVYLTIRARNFVNKDIGYDTVCPGDSVWMINTYARKEGWNYDVVWGEGNDASPDTVYRLHLYHNPIYNDTLYFLVERDSMPYVLGKDTIRKFGLTELHRYLSVHGCDSITYVQLDTLYIHREQHFYDTLQACGEAVLSWRGREITQTGDYADTVVDSYKGGTDSIHHLRADIYPTYHEIYTDSCYIEDLPYMVGGRLMQDFGEQAEGYVTAAGCDSVREYSLSRRWHHYRVSVRVKGEGSVNVTDTMLREDGSLWLAFSASACHKLDSLRLDGRNVPPQSRYLLQNLHGDCEVEAVFGLASPTESILRYEVCRDSLPIIYNGETYGEGEHTIVLRSAAGCDSVVRLYVQGKENVARLTVLDTIVSPCNASEIAFSYRTEEGSPRQLRLAFNPVAEKAGFRDTVLAASTGKQTVRIALPPSAHPDRYGMRLWQTDISGCSASVEELSFEIPYPSTIIVQKWSDVLAVLSAEYNGGYEFSGYQWYKNGEPMDGETRPYYQAKPYLRSSDTYAVLLERASDGLKLQSCGVKRKSYPKELTLELLPNPTASGEAVRVRVDGKPDAEGVIEVFDGIGKPVYEQAFRESHILPAHWQPGTYVVRVRNAKSTWIAAGKLVVR